MIFILLFCIIFLVMTNERKDKIDYFNNDLDEFQSDNEIEDAEFVEVENSIL